MATSYDNWKFKSQRVREEHIEGHYASADATLICSGPPLITGAGASDNSTVYPMGYLENFALQQSKQLQRLFEIGSSRSYFIPGRVIGAISLGRIFYNGFSLLRVLYPHWDSESATQGAEASSPAGTTINPDTYMTSEEDGMSLSVTTDAAALPAARVAPGFNKFWLNLGSDVFSKPHGLAMFFKDSSEADLGASYIENSFVQGHQLNVSAGSILIMEGASLQYDRLVPIKITSTSKSAADSKT